MRIFAIVFTLFIGATAQAENFAIDTVTNVQTELSPELVDNTSPYCPIICQAGSSCGASVLLCVSPGSPGAAGPAVPINTPFTPSCKTITNVTALYGNPKGLMVPYKTEAEWNAFLNNINPKVALVSDCTSSGSSSVSTSYSHDSDGRNTNAEE